MSRLLSDVKKWRWGHRLNERVHHDMNYQHQPQSGREEGELRIVLRRVRVEFNHLIEAGKHDVEAVHEGEEPKR